MKCFTCKHNDGSTCSNIESALYTETIESISNHSCSRYEKKEVPIEFIEEFKLPKLNYKMLTKIATGVIDIDILNDMCGAIADKYDVFVVNNENKWDVYVTWKGESDATL